MKKIHPFPFAVTIIASRPGKLDPYRRKKRGALPHTPTKNARMKGRRAGRRRLQLFLFLLFRFPKKDLERLLALFLLPGIGLFHPVDLLKSII